MLCVWILVDNPFVGCNFKINQQPLVTNTMQNLMLENNIAQVLHFF